MAKEKFSLSRASVEDMDEYEYLRRMFLVGLKICTEKKAEAAYIKYKKWAKKQSRAGKWFGFLIRNEAGKTVSGGTLWFKEAQPNQICSEWRMPYLLSLYTKPSYRRKGLAALIVKEVIKLAKKKRYSMIELHASKQGKKLYKKLGFVATSEMRYKIKS